MCNPPRYLSPFIVDGDVWPRGVSFVFGFRSARTPWLDTECPRPRSAHCSANGYEPKIKRSRNTGRHGDCVAFFPDTLISSGG
jgi:hypothetical protein